MAWRPAAPPAGPGGPGGVASAGMHGAAHARRGRWAFGLTVTAFLWAVALIGAALVVPVYNTSETLVAENGSGVLIAVAIPAALAAGVWLALHRRCSRGSRTASCVAWSLVALLTVFCVLALFSIGSVVAPVALLLAAAAALTPKA
jgi:hypothetical protein